jgi:hypothetical protein
VAWSPTGKGVTKTISLSGLPGEVVKAERMPLAAGDPKTVDLHEENGSLKAEIEESPLYIEFKAAK